MIAVDEQTREKLEYRARERGVLLAEYLKLMADGDTEISGTAASQDSAVQENLRKRIRARATAAKSIVPAANTPSGLGGEFADAMVEKYRSK